MQTAILACLVAGLIANAVVNALIGRTAFLTHLYFLVTAALTGLMVWQMLS